MSDRRKRDRRERERTALERGIAVWERTGWKRPALLSELSAHDREALINDGSQWDVEGYGPIDVEGEITALRALYAADDPHSPYLLLQERLPDGWSVLCKDGSELRVTVTVRPPKVQVA